MPEHFSKYLKTQAPFEAYIADCRQHITAHREDLHVDLSFAEHIIDTNSPFEAYPKVTTGEKRIKYGALLVHGLLACPFSLKEIGQALQAEGMLVRAVLLSGHGTNPKHLIDASYEDWIATIRFGVETLKQEVDHVYLVGYSIGATLSIYHALNDKDIAGMVLLTPAIKIKVPYSVIISWHYFLQKMTPNKIWIYRDEEIDYAKYLSLPYNAVDQVMHLTNLINAANVKTLGCRTLMIGSHEDETVSNTSAVNFFKKLPNPDNELIVYASDKKKYKDLRITIRNLDYRTMQIQHLSHVAIPFSATNLHYGETGDYTHASHPNKDSTILYGAYNQIEVDTSDQLFKVGLMKYKRRSLTYNPDFSYMLDRIIKFMLRPDASAKIKST